MWNVLENKVPTQDNLQKRCKQGSSQCSLCKADNESVEHIFLHFNLGSEVWVECRRLASIYIIWDGRNIKEAWTSWHSSRVVKDWKALPLIIIWGIWLARNSTIFYENPMVPDISASQSIRILTNYLILGRTPKARTSLALEIDKSLPQGFFASACQNNSCRGGAMLFLTENHFFLCLQDWGKAQTILQILRV